MLDRFAAAGAEVDRAGERARIPSAVVDRCIASAGKQFTLYGRDLARTARFGQGQRNKVEPLPADLDKAVSALVAAARAGEAV
jgi:trimethylamine:corrinoid methyltransferase-like protein